MATEGGGQTGTAACDAFVVAQYPALLRAAFLRTGQQASAQDLTQDALVKVIRKWRLVERADSPEAYARQVLVRLFVDGRRRRQAGEVVVADLADTASVGSAAEAVGDRDLLRRALAALPPRQRTAVVLRHYEQQSEAATAAAMGCSVGNVKSLTSRGLAALRTAMTDSVETGPGR